MPDSLEKEESLKKEQWDVLLYRIQKGRCTPFLGAGASAERLDLGAAMAKKLAEEFKYPFDDSDNLQNVAQFVGVNHNDMTFVKEVLLDTLFEDQAPPDFNADPEDPHRILAELDLPVYITTNYDDFMFQALKSQGKDPKLAICRWNEETRQAIKSSGFDSDYEPSKDQPLVFHLHGHKDTLSSLVLTEDDYIDFLVNVNSNQNDPNSDQENLPIPQVIQDVLANTSLLFVGYGLNDTTFRVLHRGLVKGRESSSRRVNITVQTLKSRDDNSPSNDEKLESIRKYLNDRLGSEFSNPSVDVYWGTAREFCIELKHRLEEKNK